MRKTVLSGTGGIFACLPLLIACSGGGGGSPDQSADSGTDVAPPPLASNLYAADSASPYSDVLVDCVLAETSVDACSLETLPLIGQETSDPSVDDILARAVISHPWIGTRFREVLEIMPDDIFILLKSVTAIVIANGIRPSNYSSGTGAVYIDPAYLWLDNSEKATISKDADFRSNFGDELPLISLARYVEGDEYAWPYLSLNGTEVRTLADIDRRFAALMFHELAHANDAFPPSEIINLDRTMSVSAAADALKNQRVSVRLTNNLPLNSQLMIDLAKVMYIGSQPTPAQLALTADQVGLEFENDGANYDYAYTAPPEDLAMLVEEIMMRHHYGVDLQIAYTDVPANDGQFCSDYIVRWGFRNRISDPLVKSRAEFGLQLLLDTADVSAYTDFLPTPVRMTNGLTWCDIQGAQVNAESLDGKDAQTLQTIDTPAAPLRPDDLRFRH